MRLFILLISLQLSFIVSAQDGWDWGNNKPEAQGKWFLLNQLIRANNFDRASTAVSSSHPSCCDITLSNS